MSKRGRPKNTNNGYEPSNYAYWLTTFSRPKELESFILKGNENQRLSMKESLLYMQKTFPDKFEEINGDKILNKLKGVSYG